MYKGQIKGLGFFSSLMGRLYLLLQHQALFAFLLHLVTDKGVPEWPASTAKIVELSLLSWRCFTSVAVFRLYVICFQHLSALFIVESRIDFSCFMFIGKGSCYILILVSLDLICSFLVSILLNSSQ